MTWVGILLLIVCLWLAFKVVGFLVKLGLWALVIGGVYWLGAHFMGLPLPQWLA